MRMNEFILGAIDHGQIKASNESKSTVSLPEPKELHFEIDVKSNDYIKQAESNFDKLVGDHELEVCFALAGRNSNNTQFKFLRDKVLHYDGYGSTQIKAHRTSPDAFAQLVKQLAFYKLYQRPAVTYESTQTRQFQLGRTEVLRSASHQSREWVASMTNPNVSVSVLHTWFGWYANLMLL
jgi:carnitine O-acetyltransferase